MFITIKNVTEKKKKTLKILIGFPSANKNDNYNRGGAWGGGRKKKNIPEDSTKQVKKIRIINVFLESLLLESFPSLGATVYHTLLRCPPTLC